MWTRLGPPPVERLRITLDGEGLEVPAGLSVAAALVAAGRMPGRTTAVSGTARAPYCMMGVCFDCLVTIDGRANQQACMTPCRAGMEIRTQAGAATVQT